MKVLYTISTANLKSANLFAYTSINDYKLNVLNVLKCVNVHHKLYLKMSCYFK